MRDESDPKVVVSRLVEAHSQVGFSLELASKEIHQDASGKQAESVGLVLEELEGAFMKMSVMTRELRKLFLNQQ